MESLADTVVRWYRANRRDLPWRRTRDPYAIWVSEIMCQQTRVATVIPYWERWMARFPTVRALADAPLDDVLGGWSGLGYYSRARNLLEGARAVVAEHGGALPSTVDGLRSIKGIGRYTAGAIASMAFDRPAALVDGNVARVLARVFAVEEAIKSTAGQRRLWQIAEAEVPSAAPGDFNQGLMELGALVCTPRAPRCAACPLAERCAARATGRTEALPVVTARPSARSLPRLAMAAAWIERGGRLLMARRAATGLYGGLWELPQAADRTALEAAFGGRLALRGSRPARVHHQLLSHRRLEVALWPGELRGRAPRLSGNDRVSWQPMAGLGALGLSTATRALIASFTKDPACRTNARSPSSSKATTRSSRG